MQEGLSETTPQPSGLIPDEKYFRLLDIQQRWNTTRWTATSLFLTISFALFGLSLQVPDTLLPPESVATYRLLERLLGLGIYWFAYLLFLRYDDWSKHLREHLAELEKNPATTMRLQESWSRKFGKRQKSEKDKDKERIPFRQKLRRFVRRFTSVSKLLAYFGLLYAVSVAALWLLGL